MVQRHALAIFAVLAGACAPVAVAQAQGTYPSRPITMVVPLPAGGTADLLCRLAAERMGGVLGQQVIVDNRPGGAGGQVGIQYVMRAPADGYTLLCAPQLTYSITHLLFAKSAFDTRGLEPVSVLASYPLTLLGRGNLPADTLPEFIAYARANPDKVNYGHQGKGNTGHLLGRGNLPANTLSEFIAYARANPDKVNYGHQGKGNTGHLLGELLQLKGNFKMTEIPYRGSAPAINDLLAGSIEVIPDYLLANKQNIDAGKLKFLATGSRERPKDYPKVATIAETLPGVYADTWMAVAAPPGTPKDVARKASDAIAQGFKAADLRARILALEAEPLGNTPDEMREMIRASEQQWAPVITAAKITID